MDIKEAINVVRSRKDGPGEFDWELLEAAEALLVLVRELESAIRTASSVLNKHERGE